MLGQALIQTLLCEKEDQCGFQPSVLCTLLELSSAFWQAAGGQAWWKSHSIAQSPPDHCCSAKDMPPAEPEPNSRWDCLPCLVLALKGRGTAFLERVRGFVWTPAQQGHLCCGLVSRLHCSKNKTCVFLSLPHAVLTSRVLAACCVPPSVPARALHVIPPLSIAWLVSV